MFNFDTCPMVADEIAIIEGEKMVDFAHTFVIVGATYSGAHFISEQFDTIEEATEEFYKYASTISYFGGGSCSIYEYSYDNDIDIVMFILI